MYPIDTYKITPNLFGADRWQAEMNGYHPMRFARRAYTPSAARKKLVHDLETHFDGRESFMQSIVLPLVVPVRRVHDRLARRIDSRRRARRMTRM